MPKKPPGVQAMVHLDHAARLVINSKQDIPPLLMGAIALLAEVIRDEAKKHAPPAIPTPET